MLLLGTAQIAGQMTMASFKSSFISSPSHFFSLGAEKGTTESVNYPQVWTTFI
jgi:hypothetical protein